jgi:HD-like signal output (HDOD) protein
MDKREILKTLADEVGHGELSFQTHATVSLRIQRALDDPDISDTAVAKLVQAEPVLAARVVAVANSIAFNASGRGVADVRSAVSRLGFRNLRSLATAFFVRQMSGAGVTNPVQKQMATQLWEHTAHVAALTHALARRVTRVDPETALFAGIIHEVGGFYLLSRAKDYPDLLEGNPADWNEEDVLELEVALGRAVLRALAVPESVMAAMEAYWQGFLAMPPRTLGDTLLLAEDLAPVSSPFRQGAKAQAKDAASEAAASIEMVLGAETLSAILKESAEEVASLASALQL